jgi:hypothetical protein
MHALQPLGLVSLSAVGGPANESLHPRPKLNLICSTFERGWVGSSRSFGHGDQFRGHHLHRRVQAGHSIIKSPDFGELLLLAQFCERFGVKKVAAMY